MTEAGQWRVGCCATPSPFSFAYMLLVFHLFFSLAFGCRSPSQNLINVHFHGNVLITTMKDPGVERAAVSVTIGQTEEYMKVDGNRNTGESFRNFEG